MAKLFNFKISERIFKLNYKRWIIIGIAALIVRYVLLAPLIWLPEGWLLVLSAVGAAEVAIYLQKTYRF